MLREALPPTPTDPPRDLPQVICPRPLGPSCFWPCSTPCGLQRPSVGLPDSQAALPRPRVSTSIPMMSNPVRSPRHICQAPRPTAPRSKSQLGGGQQDPSAGLQKAKPVLYLCGLTKASRPQGL